MHTRLIGTHSIWQLLVAGNVALALVMTIGATSASAAQTAICSSQEHGKRTNLPTTPAGGGRRQAW